jgi:hypothetical protein
MSPMAAAGAASFAASFAAVSAAANVVSVGLLASERRRAEAAVAAGVDLAPYVSQYRPSQTLVSAVAEMDGMPSHACAHRTTAAWSP